MDPFGGTVRIAAVFTDLDGTLLEPDGSLGGEAERAVARLRRERVSLFVLTSKTETELSRWNDRLGAAGGSFENGAGIVGSFGRDVLPGALGVAVLREALERIAAESGLTLTPLDALDDEELARASGLPLQALADARARLYDLPFLAPAELGPVLAPAVRKFAGLRLTRGGRFWHLSGAHDKEGAFRVLVESLAPRRPVVALGDAPNDAGFLRLADLPIVIPPVGGGLSPLAALVPAARLAHEPGGKGWAAAISSLLGEAGP